MQRYFYKFINLPRHIKLDDGEKVLCAHKLEVNFLRDFIYLFIMFILICAGLVSGLNLAYLAMLLLAIVCAIWFFAKSLKTFKAKAVYVTQKILLLITVRKLAWTTFITIFLHFSTHRDFLCERI